MEQQDPSTPAGTPALQMFDSFSAENIFYPAVYIAEL
jgi:hypothetical protein